MLIYWFRRITSCLANHWGTVLETLRKCVEASTYVWHHVTMTFHDAAWVCCQGSIWHVSHVCWNWCSKWNFWLMSEALLAWPKYGVEKSPYLALLSWSWNCHWTTVARCRPPSIRKWLKSQGESPCDDPIIPCEDGSGYGYQQHTSWDTHLLVWGIGLYKYPLMYILIYILYGLLLMNHPVLLTNTQDF